MNTSIPIEEVMGSIAEAGSFPPNSSNQADQGIHLCNPVHAGLQLLTDVLARIPGPHQARIQPTRASSRRNAADTTSSAAEAGPAVAVSSSAAAHRTASKQGGHASGAITKEELGRATWTLLHGIAAQYPDHPSRQQKKDVKQLVDSLTRIYPCGECAEHFTEIVRHEPPVVNDRESLEQWTCRIHNVVNRSIGKPSFNCDLVGARWGALDCGEGAACDLSRPRR